VLPTELLQDALTKGDSESRLAEESKAESSNAPSIAPSNASTEPTPRPFTRRRTKFPVNHNAGASHNLKARTILANTQLSSLANKLSDQLNFRPIGQSRWWPSSPQHSPAKLRSSAGSSSSTLNLQAANSTLIASSNQIAKLQAANHSALSNLGSKQPDDESDDVTDLISESGSSALESSNDSPSFHSTSKLSIATPQLSIATPQTQLKTNTQQLDIARLNQDTAMPSASALSNHNDLTNNRGARSPSTPRPSTPSRAFDPDKMFDSVIDSGHADPEVQVVDLDSPQ